MPRSKQRGRKKPRNRKGRHPMPRATVSVEPKSVDLATLPGAFVKLRRMSYGELLASQDIAYQVSISAAQGSNQAGADMNIASARVAEYRFKTCILDHNLEGENGQKLDFSQPQSMHLLDPLVGQEIDGAIEEMHNWRKALPNSRTPSASESSTDVGPETSIALVEKSPSS